MKQLSTASIITWILTEAPEVVGLLNEMQARDQLVPTTEQLANLGKSETELDAAVQRAFPGA